MITSVRLVRFKRFVDQTFDLTGRSVVLAGPNNSGKTTLLHAISAWNLAVQRWILERGYESEAARRISVTLDEFTALPLREMNLLWLDRHTSRKVKGAKTPKAAPIYIEVTAEPPNQRPASLTIEFMYANEKLVYVRPVESADDPKPVKRLPSFVRDLRIAHVPAFSGIGTQEPRHAIGMQNKYLGEGRAGEIVRNLLLDIWEASGRDPAKPPWRALAEDVLRLFRFELLPPDFSDRRAYIVCEYRPHVLNSTNSRGPKLDVANAGSGFHQVLLLLSFFYAKPSSVLLLDEPDAHLHVILQREVADHLRLVASKQSCKLLIATHAEVILDGAEPDEIVSFVGQSPRRLIEPNQKRVLGDALETLTSLDLLQAHHAGAVLYVEDESDWKILREWAHVLGHDSESFLKGPYLWPMRGKGNKGTREPRSRACAF
ncbi:AAA family ATPase [Sorangium sp. So ce315]|uniref:ATP-dependent nuclease n=1 Tax=Sorangium sp. So ce315 TaxID=3133299 RepID=UPI003F644823